MGRDERSIEGATQEIFRQKYLQNSWTGSESRSGPSSSLARTKDLRAWLPPLLRELEVRRLLDAPCGDFNWMNLVASDSPGLQFIGTDIVPEMIQDNEQKFQHLSNVKFFVLDIIREIPFRVDIAVVRDFLFHLSLSDTKTFLSTFLKSDIPYLLTTSHLPGTWKNRDIETGKWRYMDLFQAPYGFIKPAQLFPDGPDRVIALFHREDVAQSEIMASE